MVAATAALVGPEGLAIHRADRQRIADEGYIPLVVTLAERLGGSVTVLLTTVGMIAPTRH